MSLWKNIVARWGSGAGETDDVRIDASTNSLQTVDYEHHKIHSGSHFFVEGYMSFSNGQVVDFTFITPNTTEWTHMTFKIEGTAALSVEIHEGATVDAAGSAVTAYNNNRNSAHATTLTIRTGDTFTDEGTMIAASYAGANKTIGVVGRSREIILDQNSTYIFRITNETSANLISWLAEWYEHTDKN
jgi:hypothetical protein